MKACIPIWNAIRRDEDTDNIHSIFVDQWDWEKIIHKEDRDIETLKETVNTVYNCLRKTEKYMAIQYDYIEEILPHDIFFITTQELEEIFPDNTPKEREYYITKTKGAVYHEDRRYFGKRRASRRTCSGLR